MTGLAFPLWPPRVPGLVVAFALCLALACSPGRAADEPDKAIAQLRTGDYEAALAAAAVAFKDPSPDMERWHLVRLEALMATGQYRQAVEAAEEARTDDARSLRLQWAAREVLLANGESAAAEQIPEEIARLMEFRSGAYRDAASIVIYGKAMALRGTDPKVVLDKVFTVARKLEPTAREPYLASGDLALEKNDHALAARTFQEALKVFPDDPDLLCGLAHAYSTSDRVLMVSSLEAALKVNPRHVPSLLRWADHLIDAEKYDEALALLDRIEKVNPHRPEMWAFRAVLAHLQNLAVAEAKARAAALEFWPSNPLPDHLIGRKLSQKYRFAEGAARQRQALEFAPAWLPAKAQLASDLLRLGEDDEGWKLAATVHAGDAYDVAAFNLMTLHDTMTAGFTTLKNEDFTVRMAATEATIYGPRVLELLGEARRKLGAKYGIEVARPTIVEIFPQEKDFGVRTFGMPDNPGFLGVCFGRVVTATSPAASRGRAINWESVLWHEFCHVVTLQATRNRMPRWLSEGISVYEERQADPSWGEHMGPDYREMILDGKCTPVGELSGAFLSPPSPLHLQFAYYESSLVVEFIIDRYGLDAIKAMLGDLAQGIPINTTLASRVAPLETLEKDFAAHAKRLAEAMSPGLNWERPKPLLLVPGAESELETWAKDRPDNYWTLMREANRLLDAKNWNAAKVPLERLIELYPAQTGGDSAWVLLAAAHRGLDETEAERAALTRFTALDAAAPDASQRLMEIAAAAGDWETVERQARRYLAVNPLVAPPWRFLAQAGEKAGRSGAAIEAFRTLLQLDPRNPAELHYQLARLLHQNGDVSARRHVLMALEETPRHRAALKLLREMPRNTAKKKPATPAPSPTPIPK